MTNNKQQTEINAVEYLSKVNQFAKENNTDKPRQQTAVEWLLNAIETKNGEEFSSYYTEFIEQAKEMEKEKHEKFNNFLNDEKQLGISDLKTIERIQWYYNTYFNETYGGNK
jgi:lipopolysaccharide biosynthesis protein